VKNKPASSLVVSLGKLLNGMPLTLNGYKTGNNSLTKSISPVAVPMTPHCEFLKMRLYVKNKFVVAYRKFQLYKFTKNLRLLKLDPLPFSKS